MGRERRENGMITNSIEQSP